MFQLKPDRSQVKSYRYHCAPSLHTGFGESRVVYPLSRTGREQEGPRRRQGYDGPGDPRVVLEDLSTPAVTGGVDSRKTDDILRRKNRR